MRGMVKENILFTFFKLANVDILQMQATCFYSLFRQNSTPKNFDLMADIFVMTKEILRFPNIFQN